MKIGNGRNKLVWFLLPLTIVVWIIIIYNVIDFFYEDNTVKNKSIISIENKPYKREVTKDSDTSFIFLSKDPFTLNPIHRNKKKESPEVGNFAHIIVEPLPEEKRIIYKINGTILNGENRTVVIEDVSNSKTIFLKEGECYQNLTITKIEKNKVSILESNIEKNIEVH